MSLEELAHDTARNNIKRRLEATGKYDAVMTEVPYFHPGTTVVAGVMDICAVKHEPEKGYTIMRYYEVKTGNPQRARQCARRQKEAFMSAMSPFTYIRPSFVYVGKDGVKRF
jgi:hypothetical protein